MSGRDGRGKGRDDGKALVLRSAGDVEVAASEPRVRDEVGRFVVRHTEIEGAGNTARLKHEIGGNGLDKAGAVPGNVTPRLADGAGDAACLVRLRSIQGRSRRLGVLFTNARRELLERNAEQEDARGGEPKDGFGNLQAFAAAETSDCGKLHAERRRLRELDEVFVQHFLSKRHYLTLALFRRNIELGL